MMTTPSSTSATSAIVRKRVRPRITGTGTQIEKPCKVTWDDSLSLDATTITLYISDPRQMTRKWCNLSRYVSRLLNINFYQPLCPTVSCFAYCIERKAQINGTVIPWTILFTEYRQYKWWKTACRRARWYRSRKKRKKSPIPQYRKPSCPPPIL